MSRPVTHQRPASAAFDVREGRVMLSLGPLSPKAYCSFNCAFCYVQADFSSYASLSIEEIIRWVETVEDPFDVIYVSGDTDSFSRPRTSMGLDLLDRLASLGVDLLFTTRHVFDEEELRRLQALAEKLMSRGRLLFGCTSIAQLRHPHLEPKPIAPPAQRLDQLRQFRERGLISIFAMRPFLPVVPADDYIELVRRAAGSVHAILGEVWYADATGILEKRVFRDPTARRPSSEIRGMDFDVNQSDWHVYPQAETEQAVRQECERRDIPFFMRSRPALEHLRRTAAL